MATESLPPNVATTKRLLHPRGLVVVVDQDEPPLPFADGAFALVTSRDPAAIYWDKIVRVLAPGGTYSAQHVGPASVFELIEFFLGPKPPPPPSGAEGTTTTRPTQHAPPDSGSSNCGPRGP